MARRARRNPTIARTRARRVGVQRKTVYQALDAACSYFEGNLKRAPKALLEALDRRGLTEEVRAAWRLGLAPTGWQTLHERLSAAGMPPMSRSPRASSNAKNRGGSTTASATG